MRDRYRISPIESTIATQLNMETPPQKICDSSPQDEVHVCRELVRTRERVNDAGGLPECSHDIERCRQPGGNRNVRQLRQAIFLVAAFEYTLK
jgi:hypothetical protein